MLEITIIMFYDGETKFCYSDVNHHKVLLVSSSVFSNEDCDSCAYE